MPQRNGQNPIKAGNFGMSGGNFGDVPHTHAKSTSSAGHCQACKTEVPPKPGFRFSALKCPKCGASMAKK